MNTRRALSRHLSAGGFQEIAFAKLADCKVFYRCRPLHRLEISTWRACSALGLTYPENCLLGVYQHQGN